MVETIKDGTGTGNQAQVDNENSLKTISTTIPLIAQRSQFDATAFGVSTPLMTVNTTGGRVFFIKNTSNNQNVFITDFWFNWNGGNTTFNKPIYGQFIFNDTDPTANFVTSSAGVLNRSSNNTADIQFNYWDEVGNGMTGGDVGIPSFEWTNVAGVTYYNLSGAVILGPNDTIAINLRGEEVGEASINMLLYIKEV